MTRLEKYILCVIGILICIAFLIITVVADADGVQEANAWILRRNADNVLVQKTPGTQKYEYWRLWDNDPKCGAELYLTGKQSGKWVECVCLYLPEHPTGWVNSRFVVMDKPQECGLVATVTRPVTVGDTWACCKGERVKVLWRSEEWSTTIFGFIPTDALDFALTGAVTQPRRVWPDWIRQDHLINIVDVW